jgi:hypothetical protein
MPYKIYAAGNTPTLEAHVNASGGMPVGGVSSDGRSYMQAVMTEMGGGSRKNRKQRKSRKSKKTRRI